MSESSPNCCLPLCYHLSLPLDALCIPELGLPASGKENDRVIKTGRYSVKWSLLVLSHASLLYSPPDGYSCPSIPCLPRYFWAFFSNFWRVGFESLTLYGGHWNYPHKKVLGKVGTRSRILWASLERIWGFFEILKSLRSSLKVLVGKTY